MDNKKDGNTEQDKDVLKTAKKKLAETVYEAKKKLIRGLVSEAYELVFNMLSQQKQKLGGQSSIYLLPGLFIIAETHILEGRAKKAEEYLTAAYWNFLKHDRYEGKGQGNGGTQKTQSSKPSLNVAEISKEDYLNYKTNLHRTFSKLYFLKRDFNQAINELQTATYLDCVKYGPEHPIPSLNYFLLGKIFLEEMKINQAEAFFGKFAEIWYRYLKKHHEGISDPNRQTSLVNEIVLDEGLECLKFVQKHFSERYPDQNQNIFLPVTRTYYAIGFIYQIFGQKDLCRDYLKEVFRRCEAYLPKGHKKILKVRNILREMGDDEQDQDHDRSEDAN